jgi:environmental stress-induced protein Ves
MAPGKRRPRAYVYHSCTVQIIRQSSFTATPWKNGGGITYEAMRMPASGDLFRWRVSVAHIDKSGPFSDLAGYNRKMVLLRGRGVTLDFAGGDKKVLRQIGDLAEFDGAVATHCELLNGPCVDLNLMVSKSIRAAVHVEPVAEGFRVRAAPSESALIFSIEHPLLLTSDAGETQALEPWDLAVLADCGARVSKRPPGNLSAPPGNLSAPPGNLSAPGAVFFATISDRYE